jgi:hypothetical protein
MSTAKEKKIATHTLRNKSSQRPIFTLTPKFFEKVLAAEPEAASLALEWFAYAYKSLTGKTPLRTSGGGASRWPQCVLWVSGL